MCHQYGFIRRLIPLPDFAGRPTLLRERTNGKTFAQRKNEKPTELAKKATS